MATLNTKTRNVEIKPLCAEAAGKLSPHPSAGIFPLMHGDDFDALVADIRENGLREAIWLHRDGRILDGRNRNRACIKAGVELKTQTYIGPDEGLPKFIVSMNLHRRHLSDTQRAMAAADMANMYAGENQFTAEVGQICTTSAEAAAIWNVSLRTLKSARKVREHGSAKIIDACRQDEVAVSDAAAVVKESYDVQDELLDDVNSGEAKHLKGARLAAEVAQRDARLAAGDYPWPDGRWPVILADPPWQFDNPGIGKSRVENHFPTMPAEEICALDVAGIAADEAVLYIWVPNALLTDALRVIKAWGFDYKTNIAWVKKEDDPVEKNEGGMGNWVRNQHELLLIANRGGMSPPAKRKLSGSVVHAPVLRLPNGRIWFGRKPHEFHEVIEKAYPGHPYIELFARPPLRKGWAVWGNEVPEANAA